MGIGFWGLLPAFWEFELRQSFPSNLLVLAILQGVSWAIGASHLRPSVPRRCSVTSYFSKVGHCRVGHRRHGFPLCAMKP